MAIQSTLYRFTLHISDTDRGVYETREVRVARHPSESIPFFLTRLIAYALNTQEGLEFSGGISNPDDPALFVKDATGQLQCVIEIGNPSARRLHKASKSAPCVRVYTYRDFEILRREMEGESVHKASAIEIFALPPSFLNELGTTLERDNRWDFLVTQKELSITVRDRSLSCEILEHRL
jgi:uncharacterized protein YaeQ